MLGFIKNICFIDFFFNACNIFGCNIHLLQGHISLMSILCLPFFPYGPYLYGLTFWSLIIEGDEFFWTNYLQVYIEEGPVSHSNLAGVSPYPRFWEWWWPAAMALSHNSNFSLLPGFHGDSPFPLYSLLHDFSFGCFLWFLKANSPGAPGHCVCLLLQWGIGVFYLKEYHFSFTGSLRSPNSISSLPILINSPFLHYHCFGNVQFLSFIKIGVWEFVVLFLRLIFLFLDDF